VLDPVYYGSYERQDGHDWTWPENTRAYSEWVRKQVLDGLRATDDLESRADVRHDNLGYYGFSWGSRMGLIVLGLDTRFRGAVLLSGGLPAAVAPAEADPVVFPPRVSLPVLMLNGDQDFIYDLKAQQTPLFNILSTPPDRKKHVIF